MTLTPRALSAFWLGRRPYGPIHELMSSLAEARRAGQIGDVLLLLEHEPVITLGRGAQASNILKSVEALSELGVAVVETGRGGDVTLHAPGQLIAYPILDLSPDRKDVRKYVQGLTRVMRRLIAPYGLDGGTVDQLIGLWLDRESPDHFPGERAATALAKIGAIGVRISRWVTSHGFALNLSTDLALFQLIVPCGIHEHGVTSLLQASGRSLSTEQAATQASGLFAEEFDRQQRGPLTDLSAAGLGELGSAIFELAPAPHPSELAV